MKKIAVFGKPGGGKSTFSQKLSLKIDIPFYALDLIEYKQDGTKTDLSEFERQHQELIESDKWIVDGFGTITSFYQRLACADTLIYIDLPYPIHYWRVTKRLLQSIFHKPKGWPEGSSVWKGTVSSYKTLKSCPQFWNENFLAYIQEIAKGKKLLVFSSASEMNKYLANVNTQQNA